MGGIFALHKAANVERFKGNPLMKFGTGSSPWNSRRMIRNLPFLKANALHYTGPLL
jgi:hypothetical protein